jgi:anti-sigma factor RsiW
LIEPALLAFHWATLDGDERARVEEHLAGCGSCVRAWLALKRAVEEGAAGERPSEVARMRLRRAVGAELARRRRRRYLGGSAAAALVIAALLGLAGWRASRNHATDGAPAVDSALVAPGNLNFL